MKRLLELPNLNTIRFIAAMSVIVHHIEQVKASLNIPNLWGTPIISQMGLLGVNLFFVLSGFLITYLLLLEQEKYKSIDIKNFYARRILRIWPLYYFIIFLALFVLPYIPIFSEPGRVEMVHSHLVIKLALFIFFLPNMILSTFGPIPYSGQTWSIGTEEQFYLVWPFMMKYLKNKWFLILSIIIIYPVVHYILDSYPLPRKFLLIKSFWNTFWIDAMAMGGLFALIARSQLPALKRIIFSRYVQVITFLVLATMIVARFTFLPDYLILEFYSLLFGILIINFAVNENRLFNFENKITWYLGKISYGLYMYHIIAIMLSIKLLGYFNITDNIFIYLLSVAFTLAMASASYKYFEHRFIKMKIKYSRIVTGDNAGRES